MKKSRNKIQFKNREGELLVGYIDLPLEEKPHNFALFAHCFTCNKNLRALNNISRALTQSGYGVLRFDFTGLGESEGDFEDTNFSGNVLDLIDAAEFLKKDYSAPTLLVGHSLGGAAVLFAAKELEYVKAVATIGAPSDPVHVQHLLEDNLAEIQIHGKANVTLEGRQFTIKKQFVDDLLNHSLLKELKELRKPLLILHSPQDTVVSIDNAEKLYQAAFHPKSFISLDGADHLMSHNEDSLYAGRVISNWAIRYLSIPDKKKLKSTSKVAASLDREETFTTAMKLGNHSFIADEPEDFGGDDFGPSPYEFLSGALAACKAMTVQMYAKRKEWKLDNIIVQVDHSMQHADDCQDCENKSAKIDQFNCRILLKGNLSKEQQNRLLEISERCPVHKTLIGGIEIISKLATE